MNEAQQFKAKKHQQAYEDGIGTSKAGSEGTWRTAMDTNNNDSRDNSLGGKSKFGKQNRSGSGNSNWIKKKPSRENSAGDNEGRSNGMPKVNGGGLSHSGEQPGERAQGEEREGEEAERDGEGERGGGSSSPNQETHESMEIQENAHKGWSVLRQKVLPSSSNSHSKDTAPISTQATAIASIPITTELLAGQLPVMILKTWLDRDEDGNRAVPVLLGNLRFRVGDSVGLKEGVKTGKEMFKVECEYGDGAVRWVSHFTC